jgi:hypothetical protein
MTNVVGPRIRRDRPHRPAQHPRPRHALSQRGPDRPRRLRRNHQPQTPRAVRRTPHQRSHRHAPPAGHDVPLAAPGRRPPASRAARTAVALPLPRCDTGQPDGWHQHAIAGELTAALMQSDRNSDARTLGWKGANPSGRAAKGELSLICARQAQAQRLTTRLTALGAVGLAVRFDAEAAPQASSPPDHHTGHDSTGIGQIGLTARVCRSGDLLHVTKALIGQLTSPDSIRILIRQPPRGGSCPAKCPSPDACSSVQSSNLWFDLCGAMGIRTPDLLHAMNHSGILRAGDMSSDQPERQLTLTASSPGELPRAPFCPRNAPQDDHLTPKTPSCHD